MNNIIVETISSLQSDIHSKYNKLFRQALSKHGIEFPDDENLKGIDVVMLMDAYNLEIETDSFNWKRIIVGGQLIAMFSQIEFDYIGDQMVASFKYSIF